MRDERCYIASGRVDFSRFVPALIVGVLVLPLGAAAYSAGLKWIPFIWLNLFMTFGAALYGAAVAMLVCRFGRCRNPAITATVGLLFGFLLLYLAWGFWAFFVLREIPAVKLNAGNFYRCFEPRRIWALADLIQSKLPDYLTVGKHSKTTITGYWLVALWSVEALLVVAGAAAGAFGFSRGGTFCESCREWLKKAHTTNPLQVVNPDFAALTDQLTAHDFSALTEAELEQNTEEPYLKAELYSCSCGETCLMDLSICVIEADKNGRPVEKKTAVLSKWILTAEEFEQLKKK